MFKQIALAAALAVSAFGAYAADEPKWYAGVDVLKADIKDLGRRDISGGLFAGYRISDTWAVEGSIARLGNFDAGFGYANTVDQYAISGIASVPLGGSGFKVFGRLGANYLDIHDRDRPDPRQEHKLSILYGAGLSYDFTPAISGRVEIQQASRDTTRVSTGLAFKF